MKCLLHRVAWFAFLSTLAVTGGLSTVSIAAEIKLKQTEAGVSVTIDGAPFTEYLKRSGTKPILWPIIGPSGKPMTRAFPMQTEPGESKDHPHHRSLWFTHGDVNGMSFWEESKKAGEIVHKEFVEMHDGNPAKLVTRNDWISVDGKKQMEDERHLAFAVEGDNRIIDFDITLKASEGDVKFGDTKEGSFGIRVPDTMKVDAKGGGKIVNSRGQTDAMAWGQAAEWVDYHGPVGDETLGIAVLNHPSSFRSPTYWHVRTYGLFAANPFGLKEFDKNAKQDGSYLLQAGKSITLRYRVIFHRGDETAAHIADAYTQYAK